MKNILQEMIGKTPEELSGETLKLFKAIMTIADENDKLRDQISDMDFEYQKLEDSFAKYKKKVEKDGKEK